MTERKKQNKKKKKKNNKKTTTTKKKQTILLKSKTIAKLEPSEDWMDFVYIPPFLQGKHVL